MLAAITAALTGTVAINIQSAAAYSIDGNDPNSNNNNSVDKENSATNLKFIEKEKNNRSGFALCCNDAFEGLGNVPKPVDCL
jgi:hypothetical protein